MLCVSCSFEAGFLASSASYYSRLAEAHVNDPLPEYLKLCDTMARSTRAVLLDPAPHEARTVAESARAALVSLPRLRAPATGLNMQQPHIGDWGVILHLRVPGAVSGGYTMYRMRKATGFNRGRLSGVALARLLAAHTRENTRGQLLACRDGVEAGAPLPVLRSVSCARGCGCSCTRCQHRRGAAAHPRPPCSLWRGARCGTLLSSAPC